MDLLWKCFMFCLWFGIAPVAIGFNFSKRMRDSRSLALALVCGYTVIFGVSELLILPLIVAKASLQLLVAIWAVLVLAGAALGMIAYARQLPGVLAERFCRLTAMPWTMWAAVLLIALQCFVAVYFTHLDADDAFYVGTASTAVETDTLFEVSAYTGVPYRTLPSRYVLSPFPVLLAVYSRLLGMHPAVTAHVVLPLALIPLAYMAYAVLGRALFPKDKKAEGMFLMLAALIQMFSFYSVYSSGTFLLVRIWQGKAVLASILIPIIFYLCWQLMAKEEKKIGWSVLLAAMLASCLVSSMGIMLAPIVVGIFALLYGVLGWKWKIVRNAVLCCLPNLLCAGIYLWIR